MIDDSCEVCEKAMTEEEHHFCDICPDCRDDMGGLF